ncbi:MAG: T9SS type A sorting domain-containing protein [Bacteroidota bacterium]
MVLRVIFSLVVPLWVSLAQYLSPVQPFGLEGKRINDLRIEGSWIFAAADTEGVYMRYILSPDSVWRSIGRVGEKVNAVYPHFVGPLGPPLVVTVGVTPTIGQGDTTRVYCSSDFGVTWTPSDTGIAFSELSEVVSIDGFPSLAICGETFISGSGRLYRSSAAGWEKVYEGGGRLLGIGPSFALWAGGTTVAFSPFVARSTDAGDSWETSSPFAGGDNEVYSLAETNSGVVYIGLREYILRSDDSSKTWFDPTLCDILLPRAWWLALEVGRDQDNHVLVGGALLEDNSFVMLESQHGGDCWEIFQDDSVRGISTIVRDPYDESIFYVGTVGSGVFKFTSTITGIDDQEPIPKRFYLEQNYPNPFNPSTTIRYGIPSRSHVVLKIYDLLGQELATLVDEEKVAGRYEVMWDAVGFSSGVYFYRLKTGEYVETRRLLVMK